MSKLPAIEKVPTLDAEGRAQVLDLLFEPCTQLHTLAVEILKVNTYPSYERLIDAVGLQLIQLFTSNLESDRKWLDAILAAHPRLGEKKVESEQSKQEQAQLNQGDPAETERLAALNAAYEAQFPGLRYVVFVNGRGRSVILEDISRRIERNDAERERRDAIQAMCDIAVDRASKLL